MLDVESIGLSTQQASLMLRRPAHSCLPCLESVSLSHPVVVVVVEVVVVVIVVVVVVVVLPAGHPHPAC